MERGGKEEHSRRGSSRWQGPKVGERPACPRTAKRPARLGYPRPCRAEEEGTSGEVTGAVRGASQATVRGRGRRLRRGPRPSARQDLTAHLVPARAPPPSPHATPPPARRQTRCHLPPTGGHPPQRELLLHVSRGRIRPNPGRKCWKRGSVWPNETGPPVANSRTRARPHRLPRPRPPSPPRPPESFNEH